MAFFGGDFDDTPQWAVNLESQIATTAKIAGPAAAAALIYRVFQAQTETVLFNQASALSVAHEAQLKALREEIAELRYMREEN